MTGEFPVRKRKKILRECIEEMRTDDKWHPFQDFCLSLLAHEGYQDVRLSAVRNDFGRDAVAHHPDGRPCFVAVSFACGIGKIRLARLRIEFHRSALAAGESANAHVGERRVRPPVAKRRDARGKSVDLYPQARDLTLGEHCPGPVRDDTEPDQDRHEKQQPDKTPPTAARFFLISKS